MKPPFGERPAFLGHSTRFEGLSRLGAFLVLGLFGLAIFGCETLLARSRPRDQGKPQAVEVAENQGDLGLFKAIVERIGRGEGYYEAFASEARQRGYGTRSVFNWRTPLHLWFLGHLPGPGWRLALIGILAAFTGGVAFVAMERDGGFPLAVIAALILAPALCFSIFGALFAETWAGLLILLSIGLAALGWRASSVTAGLLALFLRELAFPYVVISFWLAWRGGRRGEWWCWLSGLAAYSVYYTNHAMHVVSLIGAADKAYPSSWLQWGGPAFVLQTMRFGLLGLFPIVVASTGITLAILGMVGERGKFAVRVSWTTATYALLLASLGKPFNDYWGLLYSPLLCLGIAWSPAALRDLLRSLLGRKAGRSAQATA
jgi:hypothetical protein